MALVVLSIANGIFGHSGVPVLPLAVAEIKQDLEITKSQFPVVEYLVQEFSRNRRSAMKFVVQSTVIGVYGVNGLLVPSLVAVDLE